MTRSKSIVNDFLALRTLIFAIHYSVFEGFSQISIIASKMLSKSLLSSQNVPRWLQNVPKSLSRRPKRLPRRSQDAPRGSQDAPKTPQELPKSLPRRAKTLQEAPKSSQEAPKRLQEAPRASQEPPKRPQEAPKMLHLSYLALPVSNLPILQASKPSHLQRPSLQASKPSLALKLRSLSKHLSCF